MAGIIAMTLDGVLRSVTNKGPLRSGLLLYRALEAHASLAIIADTDTEESAKYWLATNGLDLHAYLVLPKTEDPLDDGERRVIQINRLKESSSVDFLIDPDPTVAQAVMASGTPVMLSLHPVYARPEFLPDYRAVAKPWDVLTKELVRQQDLRAKDTREVETI